MKKAKKKYKVLQVTFGAVIIALTLYLVINAYIGVTYAVELNGNQAGITIDQTKLFNVKNLYPGQPPTEAKEPLKIKNTGISDLQCYISSKLDSGGDPRLFDILKLGIQDEKGMAVYSGNLGSLNELALGTIKPGHSKTFDFTLELPADVDNSYQKLNTSFKFNIAASGGGSSGGSTGGSGNNNGDDGNVTQESDKPEVPPPSGPIESAVSNPIDGDNGNVIQESDKPEVLPLSEPQVPAAPEVPNPIKNKENSDIVMPNTGVPSHLPYYSVGLAVIFTGLFVGYKKK